MERRLVWYKGNKYPVYEYQVSFEIPTYLARRLLKMAPPGYYREDEEISMDNTAKEVAGKYDPILELQHVLAGKLEYTNDLSQLIQVMERCKNFLPKKDIDILIKFTMRGVYSSPGL